MNSDSDAFPTCYRCGRVPSEKQKDGGYWCSWCGQSFHPKDAVRFREDEENKRRKKVEEEERRGQELLEDERKRRASLIVVGQAVLPYCSPAWLERASGRNVVALYNLKYGVITWSNRMNWHPDGDTRPERVVIPEGTTGQIHSFNPTLQLVAIQWHLGLLKRVILWYDEQGFVGQVGFAS